MCYIMQRMIDANIVKALSGLFAKLSDLSDEELGRFVRTAVKVLACSAGPVLTKVDVESLADSIYEDAGEEEEPQEEETLEDIPEDESLAEDAIIINGVLYPYGLQSVVVHFKPKSEESCAAGECEQECCCLNKGMVYEEVTGNMDNVHTEGKDDAQEQERLKACSRVAAFIRDNRKATHLEIWQHMQNEGLSTAQDAIVIGNLVDDLARGIHIRGSLISFIHWKTLLENGQARFVESRSKDKEATVGWRLYGDICKSAGVMLGYEQGSLFMVTHCDSLLPEYISVKLRRVMCERYDAIMEDVYAMCARLSKADAFNAVPITKDEFNTLRNLVL